MLVKPTLLKAFVCKASECRHTCCAGWEISVDPDTAELYDELLSDDERERLEVTPEGILLCREGERCGFLCPDGLCSLIISHGEDVLCDICREHPRFYSYSEDDGICEAGVGLCCEKAAELWLSEDPRFVISGSQAAEMRLSKDRSFAPNGSQSEELRSDEAERFIVRGEADEVGEEEEPSKAELSALGAQLFLINGLLSGEVELPRLDYAELLEVFRSFETLEPLELPDSFEFTAVTPELRRLAVYYVFRWYFEFPSEALELAAICCMMTAALGGDIYDSARRISCEVEYDSDNTERLIELISKKHTI